MSQTRLFVTGNETTMTQLARLLEPHFEDEGLPVSLFETEADSPVWSVSVYVPAERKEEATRTIQRLAENAGLDISLEEETLGEINWVAETLEELGPVEAGRFIVHGSHDRHRPKAHQHAICVDAGLAFGTGHHGTTAGCLEVISAEMKAHKFVNVLDVGTGSGVLAIGVARAANIQVLASDIDPQATITARENCRLNGVSNRVTCVTATGFNHPMIAKRKPYDLIIANILARPLEMLAREMAAHAAANSTLVLSGLLPHQKARIVAAYRLQGFFLERALIRDGWLVLVLKSRQVPHK